MPSADTLKEAVGPWRIVRTELASFDGRLSTAWRTALICALITMAFMTYQIPLAPLACYLALFVMKPNTSESMLMGLAITVLVAVVVVLMLGLTRISIEHPAMRLAIIAISSFLFMFLGAASPLGPAGSIVALVISFLMTLVGDVPFGEVATRGILYAWLMSTVPMVILLACNAPFAGNAAADARAVIARRLRSVGRWLQDGSTADEVISQVREGNDGLQKTLIFVRLFHLVPSAESTRLKQAMDSSYALLSAVAALASRSPAAAIPDSPALARACLSMAEALDSGRWPPAEASAAPAAPSSHPVSALIAAFPALPGGFVGSAKAPKQGFLVPDAISNPSYVQFALKTTGAAILCYLIYTALQWQDIHTAMITCYVGALITVGETAHKLFLRIVGALIGAAMGMASVAFLMPHMTSIGELMLLMFVGTFIAGWVAAGSERSAYAGVQIGLCFFLTVLQGFGPDVKMSVAVDRVIGILLGNVVLYLIFTRVSPVSAVTMVRAGLKTYLDRLAIVLAGSQPVEQMRTELSGTLPGLEKLRDQLALAHFEPHHLHSNPDDIVRLRSLTQEVESLVLQAAFPAHDMPVTTLAPAVAQAQHTLVQAA